MGWYRCLVGWIVFAAVLSVGRVAGAAPPDDDFDAKAEAELQEIDESAVEDWRAANAAREADDWETAIARYDAVLEKAPDFDHAHRRKCGMLMFAGRHDAGIQSCRTALLKRDSPENRVGLMLALAGHPSASDHQKEEAARMARDFLRDPPDTDPVSLAAVCQTVLMLGDLDQLETCHGLLVTAAPDDAETHYIGWALAASEGDWADAEAELTAAEAAGLDPAAVAELRTITSDARPWWSWLWPNALYAIGGWFAVFGLLILLGVVLSAMTLRAAEQLPSRPTGEATGGHGLLRKTYAAVLALTCIFYYVSIPLMLLVVVGLGGGMLYGILVVGHIPIKLLLIIAAVVFVTVVAVLKSLLIKRSDADPGEKLDLAEHPGLAKLLEEVAGKVGTRPVDNVYLVPDADIAVFERGSMWKQLRGKSERCLVLGVAALDGMKVGPLSAILAHEYGHFSNRDTAGGGFALAVRQSMATMARSLAEGGAAGWYNPAWLFVVSFYKLFLRISQGASRLQEILADRWAVFSYGAPAFESGLRHVIARSVRFDADANVYLNEVVSSGGAMKNLYDESPGRADGTEGFDADRTIQEVLEAEPSPFDSHPRPLDRFRWAHALASDADPGPAGEADVWSVIGGRAALENLMTEHVRRNVAASAGIAIPSELAASAE